MRRLLALVLLVGACDSGERTTVRMDFSNLWLQAAQTDLFTTAELRVTGEGMDPLIHVLTPDDMSFDLEVPSGSERSFAVEGYNEDPDGGTERLTQYWGYDAAHLPAGGEIDITVPVTRAGRLPGTVMLSVGTLPASVEVSFDYFFHPIEELPGPFVVVARDGAFSLPLPLGEYSVTMRIGDTAYASPEPAFVDYQGLNSPAQLWLEAVCTLGGAVQCCGDGDCDGGTCNLSTHQCEAASQAVVQVFAADGAPYSLGATVVVHSGAGVYISQYTTDATGGVSVDVASGEMVSVLYSDEDSYTNYHLLTIMGVEPGDTLDYHLPGYVGSNNIQEGTLDVSAGTVPGGQGFETQWVTIPSAGGFHQVPYSTLLFTYNLSDSGDLDVLGWAIDTKTTDLMGFAVHTGLTAQTDGMLTLGESPGYWDTSPLSINMTFANTPADASIHWDTCRDGASFNIGDQFIDVIDGGSYQLPGGFFDNVEVSARVQTWPMNQLTIWHFINDTWPNPLHHDFLVDMLPPIDDSPTPPAIDFAVPTRPAVNWTSTAVPSEFDVTRINVSIEGMAMDYFYWRVVAPPTASGPITVPDMSATGAAAGFLPENYQDGYASFDVELLDVSLHSGYRAFMNAIGLISDPYEEPWPEDQAWTLRTSSTTSGG